MGSSSTTGKMHTPRLLLLPLLVVAFSSLDCHLAADDHGAQSIITVVGSVVSQSTNAPYSGALIGVRCKDGDGRIVFLRQAVTDSCGRFRVPLNPSPSDARLASVKTCYVQPLQRRPKSSNTAAHCDAAAAPSPVNMESGDVVSIGTFSVRPGKTMVGSENSKGLFFPPIPLVPEPPNIGGVPIPPFMPGSPSILPPLIPGAPPLIPGVPLPTLIPGCPPASLLPPILPPLIPGVPSPPSSILPPIPKIPGIPQIPPIPKIPGVPTLPPIPLIPGGAPAPLLPPSILPPIPPVPKIPGVPLLPPIPPLIPGGPPAA